MQAQAEGVPGCVVLLVDDDPELLDLVEVLLGMCQCQAVRAATGGEALPQLLRAQERGLRPCLILLDLMLPDERGEDVHARLKAAAAAVPVVIMSASADGAQRAGRIGVPFLPKPFGIDQLIDTVRAHCPSAQAP